MTDPNELLRDDGEDRLRDQFDHAQIGPSPLDEAHTVFRKWLSDKYNCDVLDIVMAACAAHRLGGDPLWLLVISGSGAAKTETVSALSETGVLITSTLTSDAALLSASPKRTRAKSATGGLLLKIGEDGVLVIKDVTSILAMNSNTRAPLLAAFREIYDGRWERNVGTDGGQTLTWEGHLTVIGAVTTAWDDAHAAIAAMGDRFVLARFDSAECRIETGEQAIRNGGHEREMRKELCAAAKAVLDAMSSMPVTLTNDEQSDILNIADAVTFIRTAVITDYRGDVMDAHAPEAPTRFAKQLAQVFKGSVAIGIEREKALDLVIKAARDSAPPARLTVLLEIDRMGGNDIKGISEKIGKPQTTVKRWVEALLVLGLVKLRRMDDGSNGFWLDKRLNTKGFQLLNRAKPKPGI